MRQNIQQPVHLTRYCLTRFMTEEEAEQFDSKGVVPALHKDPYMLDERLVLEISNGLHGMLDYLPEGTKYVWSIDRKKLRTMDHVALAMRVVRKLKGIELVIKDDETIIFTKIKRDRKDI